jgi:hypothetical protein
MAPALPSWLAGDVHALGKAGFEERVQHFTMYRDAGDMVNAVHLLDAIADELYWIVCSHKTIDTRLPSIVSAFMPKSGGTFLFNRLVLFCGYAEYHWSVSNPTAPQSVYAVPRALRNYLDGGCAHHAHFLPTPHNVAALDDAGVRKVWLHVRHPAEVVQSAYFHYAGQGQGEGEIGRRRSALVAREAALLGIDADARNPEKLNAFFRDQITWVVGWLRMWLMQAEARPGFVFVTSHRELRDPAGLLRRVFEAFDVPVALDDVPGSVPSDRRRTGHANDWREQLTPETIRLTEAVIAERLRFSAIGRELCGLT